MDFIDELNYKSYEDIDEDVKLMDADELKEELSEKLEELEECNAFEDAWLQNHDEDALDTDFCENAGYIAELNDEISDLIIAYKKVDPNGLENNFPEISERLYY
jgi:hypothetical protein